jgi:hypothetical protein
MTNGLSDDRKKPGLSVSINERKGQAVSCGKSDEQPDTPDIR